MCTQNQFTVQMFMKPVHGTDVNTDYTWVELNYNYNQIGKVEKR